MDKFAELERRIAALEESNRRFVNALCEAAKTLLANPMAGPFLPKKMKDDLTAFVSAHEAGKIQ